MKNNTIVFIFGCVILLLLDLLHISVLLWIRRRMILFLFCPLFLLKTLVLCVFCECVCVCVCVHVLRSVLYFIFASCQTPFLYCPHLKLKSIPVLPLLAPIWLQNSNSVFSSRLDWDAEKLRQIGQCDTTVRAQSLLAHPRHIHLRDFYPDFVQTL